MNRLSLHIGLNQIDPAVWGEGNELVNCINDCDYYTQVAIDHGFTPTILKDSEATGARVTAEICKASSDLSDGDYFLLTYAGHGSQVPDEDNQEDDGMNETWVLYDRHMVDNEIYRMWSYFQPGVKIFVLSDSCHSGTLMRLIMKEVKPQIRKISPLSRTFKLEAKKGGRDIQEMEMSKDNIIRKIRSFPKDRSTDPDKKRAATTGKIRLLPIRNSLENYVQHRDLYRNIMLLAGDKRDIFIDASLLYISGCQDNQTSGDGPEGTNGTFTGNLKRTWNDGTFTGDYLDFYKRICGLMPMDQSPNYMKLGLDTAFYEQEKPFVGQKTTTGKTEKPVPVTEEPSTPEPSGSTSGPASTVTISGSVGKNGTNKKADVMIVQELLNKVPPDEGGLNVKLKVDGICGDKTNNAIIGFKMYYGFDADENYRLFLPDEEAFNHLVWRSSFRETASTKYAQ